MEGPRACKKEELEEVINLANLIFRTPNGLKPTMGEEFRLLLSEDNLDNIRVIKEDGKVVAAVNYYKSTINVDGALITAASIGAVCTDNDYRGKGYSSKLLDDIDERLKKDKIQLLLVSGGRGLYLRRGLNFCGRFHEYTLKEDELNSLFLKDIYKIQEIKDFPNKEAVAIYNSNRSYFIRSKREFNELYLGGTTVWGNIYYKTYGIYTENRLLAYFIIRIRINTPSGSYGEIIEAAGDSIALINGFKEAIKCEKINRAIIRCGDQEAISIYLENLKIEKKEINQVGTLKIISFNELVNSQRERFKKYLTPREIADLSFLEANNKMIIEYKGEELSLENGEAERLILGSFQEQSKLESVSKEFQEILNRVLPITLPWAANLNYQ